MKTVNLIGIALLAFSMNVQSQTNTAPKANAGADIVLMDSNSDGMETVVLNGSGSTDNGTIQTYEWKQSDGTVLEPNSVSFSKDLLLGEYEFVLRVTDNEGLSSEDRVKVFVADPTNNNMNRISIRNGTEDVFVSGMNIAWDDFANDLDVLDEVFFTKVFDDIQAAGGNAVRWWLHTNGRNSPRFGADGKVTGIDPKEIVNMRKALDLAYERGIVISMCLWSFDMLQDQGQNQAHMKQLIENREFTQTYIDKALIPTLQEIGDHPAVMTWEIFNEGEGLTTEFGWADMRSEMKYVQQFVNLLAGAIHRQVPGALVSNSGWSFKAGTDIEGNFNYYTDERLIAAGGDELGTLDFYQIHYYPEHFGNEYSPFHRPASHWQLDKPIVIGEFPAYGVDKKAEPNLSTTEAYKRAYEYGYAGVMSWTYTGHLDGDYTDAVEGMTYLRENYANALDISVDLERNNPPYQTDDFPLINIIAGSTAVVDNAATLSDFFLDEENGSNLTFSIYDKGNAFLAVPEITSENNLKIIFVEGATGRSEIVVQARDSDGYSTWASIYVNVQPQNGNLVLFKNVSSTSEESLSLLTSNVNDGDESTRWSSLYEDDQYLVIDFSEKTKFDRVRILWEFAYGKGYSLQVSDDSVSWVSIFDESNGNGGEDLIAVDGTEARYLRLHGITRGTVYGFSIWEIQVFKETPTPVENEIIEELFQVSPNPASDNVSVVVTPSLIGSEIICYNVQGREILRKEILSPRVELNVHEWSRGLYLIKVISGKSYFLKKLITR